MEIALNAINKSKILFGFLDATNPSGIGLATEVGYAHAKGVYNIFVCENEEIKNRKYWQFVHNCCNDVVIGLKEGIQLLKKRIVIMSTVPMPYSL